MHSLARLRPAPVLAVVALAVAALAAALLGAGASAAGAAPAAAAGASADTCRAAITSNNWRAVFSHEPSLIKARARLREIQKVGFRTAKIENRGCNDYAVVLESPEFSKYKVRLSFAQQAERSRLSVSYALPGNAKAKPGDVVVVFGHRTTLVAARALLADVARRGWRETDIAYGGPRDWKVVWPNVPGSASEETVRQALEAGFEVELELVG